MLERVERRVRELNPRALVVGSVGGRIDPALLYDLTELNDEPGQLSLRELFFEDMTDDDHAHADSVTVTSAGCIDPGRLVDLLEKPPANVYRLKGTIAVRHRAATRGYVVNLVGTSIHIATAGPTASPNCLVAIGMHLDTDDVRARLGDALRPHDGPASADSVRRLQRYRRLSI
jgi:G3E family GTPase